MLHSRIRLFAPLTTERQSRFTHRPRFSSSPFRPQSSLWHTRSSSGFVATFHSRGYESSVSFSSIAESRCNDFNLERASRPFRSSPFLPYFDSSFDPYFAVYKCRARAHSKFTIVYPREMKRMPGDYRGERKSGRKETAGRVRAALNLIQ